MPLAHAFPDENRRAVFWIIYFESNSSSEQLISNENNCFINMENIAISLHKKESKKRYQ